MVFWAQHTTQVLVILPTFFRWLIASNAVQVFAMQPDGKHRRLIHEVIFARTLRATDAVLVTSG